MLTPVIELFINDKRVFKTLDLHDLAELAYPNHLSIGVDTGMFDRNNNMIATNHMVTFKGNLCRLTIYDGYVAIKHPKYGYVPLTKYHQDCQIIR